jgi:hypothetical protein
VLSVFDKNFLFLVKRIKKEKFIVKEKKQGHRQGDRGCLLKKIVWVPGSDQADWLKCYGNPDRSARNWP